MKCHSCTQSSASLTSLSLSFDSIRNDILWLAGLLHLHRLYYGMHVSIYACAIVETFNSKLHSFGFVAISHIRLNRIHSQHCLIFSKCKMTMRHTVVWCCFRFRIKSIKWFISIFLLFVWKVQFDSLLTVGAGFEFMCGLNRNKITIATGFGLWMRLSNSMCLYYLR